MSLLTKMQEAGGPPAELSERELRILGAALRSFAARGYAGSNLRQIAADAGLTAPMINYYFESKEALYQRLAELVMRDLGERVESCVAAAPDVPGKLAAVVRAHRDFALGSRDALAFLLGLVYGPSEERPRVDLEALYQPPRALARTLIASAVRHKEIVLHPRVTLEEAVEAFEALVDRIALRAFKSRSVLDERALGRAIALAFGGVGRWSQNRTPSGKRSS